MAEARPSLRFRPLARAALGAAALLVLGRAPAPAADLVELARTAKPAVVNLLLYDQHGQETSSGSGFFLDADGHIVTNVHVVKDAYRVIAQLADGRNMPVLGVVAEDETNDVAIVQAKYQPGRGESLTLAPAAPALEPGEKIFVIGAPRGLSGTVSEGIVSAIRKRDDIARYDRRTPKGQVDLIQLTAAISPGSSGSPVLDTQGRVVAVATSQLIGGQNLNFAVPVGVVHKLMATITAETKPRPIRALAEPGENPRVRNLLISAVVLGAGGFGFWWVVRQRPSPPSRRSISTRR